MEEKEKFGSIFIDFANVEKFSPNFIDFVCVKAVIVVKKGNIWLYFGRFCSHACSVP